MKFPAPYAASLAALLGLSFAGAAKAAVIVKVDKKSKTLVLEMSPAELEQIEDGETIKLKDKKNKELSGLVKGVKGGRVLLAMNDSLKGQKAQDSMTLVAQETPSNTADETDEFGYKKGAAPAAAAPVESESAGPGLKMDLVKASPSPAKGMLGPNRNQSAVTMIRADQSRVGARVFKPEAKIEVSEKAAGKTDDSTIKLSGQTLQFEGTYVTGSGIRIGGRVDQGGDQFKFPDGGGKVKHSHEDISVLGAAAIDRNLAVGVELLMASRKTKSGGSSASESFMRILPSVAYMENSFEIIGSWRPTTNVQDENGLAIEEAGYVRVDGLYKLSPGLFLTGQLTRNAYASIDSDNMDDAFDLKAGGRMVQRDLEVGGELSYYQGAMQDDELTYDPQYMPGYGLTVDGLLKLHGGHALGAAVTYEQRNLSGKTKTADYEVKSTALDLTASYVKTF